MPVDRVYLESIRELEEENKVEFPKEVIHAFAEKTWTCADYSIYADQVFHASCSVEGIPHLDRYNFFNNYYNYTENLSGLETTKKELYKKCIPLPQKCFIKLDTKTFDEPREYYVTLDKEGDYWCWDMGSNKSWFSPILCLYNEKTTRYFDASYSMNHKDESGVTCEYILDSGDGDFSFDLTQRENNKIIWEDDEKVM